MKSTIVLPVKTPDFVLVRASALQNILVMLNAAAEWFDCGEAVRARHCFLTARGQLRNVAGSAPLLADFVQSCVDAGGVRMSGEATCAAAGVPAFVTPPSNTGVNKILSLAQGIK